MEFWYILASPDCNLSTLWNISTIHGLIKEQIETVADARKTVLPVLQFELFPLVKF